MDNPVGWFELYTHDILRAKQFYEAVFLKELTPLPTGDDIQMYAFQMVPNSAGASGSIVSHPMRKPSSEGTLIYFSCDDCEVEAARIPAAGGQIICPKMSIGQFGFFALAMDTEGNTIGLHSFK